MRYNRLIEEVRPLLLSRMGGCRWALLAVAMVVVASMACHGEQDVRPLKVSGWIDGYFVSPGGDLVFRTLDVSSSPAVETDVALHPLWAGYRVRLSFAAHDDVTAIVVSALESGAVLTVKRFVRPRSWPGLLLVNDDDGGFCHSSDGLSYKLTVTYRDGGTADAIVSLDGVSLLPAFSPGSTGSIWSGSPRSVAGSGRQVTDSCPV